MPKFLQLLCMASLGTAGPLISYRQESTTSFTSDGNPILSDGSFFSADPAPFAVDEQVYILTGRDEAPENVNDFVMNEWQIFEATNPSPSGGDWLLHHDVARPNEVFTWAQSGGAYASQIVPGRDGNFYLFASARESNGAQDPFSIGVAVSDNPTGPFTDAHPEGPIISQRVPSQNDIHNIDPSVLIDGESAYIYWGSFGQLRAAELGDDMTTIIGNVQTVTGLTGFFEAPWLMKRDETYYMIYAANNAGPDSPCTPTSYHACLAYGTASSPLGPWTFQDVILGVVSSTTSHPGTYSIGDQWYLVYHTADAENGDHFRRSVAFDVMEFDDSASPPTIKKIDQTFREELTQPPPATRNIALQADAESSVATPIQYWIAALNDGKIKETPLPPDYWSSYMGDQSPAESVLTYTWSETVQLNGVSISFFADQPAGSNVGVPPPASWYAEWLDGDSWKRVDTSDSYPTSPSVDPPIVDFETVTTNSLRVHILASGGQGTFGGVGVREWMAYEP